MKKINLRAYYPAYYHADTFVEVPDEVALLLQEYARLEEAYRIRTYRHKAFYSLDRDEGIWREIKKSQQTQSPLEMIEKRYMTELIYEGLSMLSPKQRKRIYMHYFLGMSIAEIAKAEQCAFVSVKESIERGMKRLEKFFQEKL